MAIFDIDGGLKEYVTISSADELHEVLLENWPKPMTKIEVAVRPLNYQTYPPEQYEVEISWELSPEDEIRWDDDQLVFEILWNPAEVEGFPEEYVIEPKSQSQEDLVDEALDNLVGVVAEELFEEIEATFRETGSTSCSLTHGYDPYFDDDYWL